jgi:hypothetical protein
MNPARPWRVFLEYADGFFVEPWRVVLLRTQIRGLTLRWWIAMLFLLLTQLAPLGWVVAGILKRLIL